MATNSPPRKRQKQDSNPVQNPELKFDTQNSPDRIKCVTCSKEQGSDSKLDTQSEQSCVETEISSLKEESSRLKVKLESLSCECSDLEMGDLLDKLHQYNDIKDVTQILLGKLADLDGIPISSLYSRFGLNSTD